MKKHIPNCITLLNLISGLTSIALASHDQFMASILMLCLALLFDFCDGLVARLLHVKSELGKQLDSLSDLVSFGVAPAFILYLSDVGQTAPYFAEGAPSCVFSTQTHGILVIPFAIYAIFVAAGALRLGKFNLDERQTENFRGLPIPLAAFTLLSLFFAELPYFVNYTACLLISLLMLSNIPLFSLKFKNLKWKENLHRYLFLLLCVALLFVFDLAAIPLITICYIIVSLVFRKKFAV